MFNSRLSTLIWYGNMACRTFFFHLSWNEIKNNENTKWNKRKWIMDWKLVDITLIHLVWRPSEKKTKEKKPSMLYLRLWLGWTRLESNAKTKTTKIPKKREREKERERKNCPFSLSLSVVTWIFKLGPQTRNKLTSIEKK